MSTVVEFLDYDVLKNRGCDELTRNLIASCTSGSKIAHTSIVVHNTEYEFSDAGVNINLEPVQ